MLAYSELHCLGLSAMLALRMHKGYVILEQGCSSSPTFTWTATRRPIPSGGATPHRPLVLLSGRAFVAEAKHGWPRVGRRAQTAAAVVDSAFQGAICIQQGAA